MPRPIRIEYEGARYHVLSRGDRREDIVFDDEQRKRFVQTLGEAATQANWQVHAFCRGHLFSGRYKSIVVDEAEDGSLRRVCDYAHLDPVRAKLVGEAGPGKDGIATLLVGGKEAGKAEPKRTVPAAFSASETFAMSAQISAPPSHSSISTAALLVRREDRQGCVELR